ncbi:hemolysin family protein [Gloeocapsa sp. PCC 73106]|uniref:hemolysin family protein n=1 Tax=Gloeocapsa sp. PCC 73106 TaxID=102232 RepID=UPI0002ACA2DD|nr:hemolysin family protein [Gloeocapsa sp. PCC 73106]ELS00142.1 CBS domain-containing protein [Gloeocapsa sp. PCC 73106]
MSAIITEIVFVLLLIIANGIFSGSEIAVVSARKVRLEQMVSRGNKKAKAALKLANSPNDFLSTVQIGITLIGILSGAVGGATLAQRLKPVFDNIELLKPYSEGLSVVIVVTIITYLSLVIGELTPKRVALNDPEKIACAVAKPMRLLSKLTAPFVTVLSFSTEVLLKLFGIQASTEPEVTAEEIKVLIEQATVSGMFEESEQEMVERVFRLGDRPIKALMTPRFEIVWLNIEASLEENQRQITESNYSRFPVCHQNLNNCLGILRGSNFLSARLVGQEVNLETMLQQPLYVPENITALKVLEQFKKTGIHLALITDEYGDIEGLVTFNDLLEAIVGDISSFEDIEEPMIIQRDDGSWLLDGLLSIDDLKDLLDKESLPGEETRGYHTLGGFVVDFLGHIPKSAEHFDWEGLRFEVVDMDGTRVDKVLVGKGPGPHYETPQDEQEEN